VNTDHAHPDQRHPDHARPNHTRPEHAHPEARSRSGRPAALPFAEVGSVLEAVCRNVTELAKAAPKPPSRIRMEDGQTRVEVEWHHAPHHAEVPHAPAAQPAASVATVTTSAGPGPAAGEPADTRTYVRSPIVGTFYHAGAPDAPPFVQVGDVVQPGQQVGVLEAMKMMSSVAADQGGRVVEVLAGNAQRVEFDQPLIALEPVTADEGA
jgi:acetyl-CoA carboxylase biotin carboxyl carrier protein